MKLVFMGFYKWDEKAEIPWSTLSLSDLTAPDNVETGREKLIFPLLSFPMLASFSTGKKNTSSLDHSATKHIGTLRK